MNKEEKKKREKKEKLEKDKHFSWLAFQKAFDNILVMGREKGRDFSFRWQDIKKEWERVFEEEFKPQGFTMKPFKRTSQYASSYKDLIYIQINQYIQNGIFEEKGHSYCVCDAKVVYERTKSVLLKEIDFSSVHQKHLSLDCNAILKKLNIFNMVLKDLDDKILEEQKDFFEDFNDPITKLEINLVSYKSKIFKYGELFEEFDSKRAISLAYYNNSKLVRENEIASIEKKITDWSIGKKCFVRKGYDKIFMLGLDKDEFK